MDHDLAALLDDLVSATTREEVPSADSLLAVLATDDDDLLDVVAAAARVRRRWFGRRVKLAYLVNLKSGLCPEDCTYCSQRLGSAAEILRYTWLRAPRRSVRRARASTPGRRACASWRAGAAPRSAT